MKTSLQSLYDLIDSYLEKIESDDPILEYQDPKQLIGKINPSISKKGENIDELFGHIQDYLKYCVHTGNKQFFNQLYAGFNLPAFIGDVVTSLTNTSMYTYEVAPVATALELELIKKMNEFTGFKHGEGTFVTGGSNANLIAMFSARNKKLPEGKQYGIYGTKSLTAFVSDQAHYSFATAANVLGIGTNCLRRIKSDKNGCMVPSELEKRIEQSIEQDETPFFVAATAGTTLLGAYDPIEALANICKKHHIWLHVDGSFGGSAILSQKYRHLFNGIERADSFAWNPHKLMNIPLICSVILVKQKGTLQQNLIALNTDYIFHESETQTYDLGKKSIQCGRRVDSLKLWLSWKYFGDEGYEKRINTLFDIAAYMEQKVKESKTLELLAPNQSFTVCFRYKPPENIDANDFNKQLRDNLRLSGKSAVNYGFIGNTLAIRFVVANPEVGRKDVDRFLKHIYSHGEALIKNL